MKIILRNKRAISPVIATVILVAVAISVAVAVAYWMGGIAGMYTKFEKIEIQSAYAPLNTTASPSPITGRCWNITMILKNTGSADATLISAYVNNKPLDQFTPRVLWYSWDGTGAGYQVVPTSGVTIVSGRQITTYLLVDTDLFTSGTTLNMKLHSAGGMDYIKLVELT